MPLGTFEQMTTDLAAVQIGHLAVDRSYRYGDAAVEMTVAGCAVDAQLLQSATESLAGCQLRLRQGAAQGTIGKADLERIDQLWVRQAALLQIGRCRGVVFESLAIEQDHLFEQLLIGQAVIGWEVVGHCLVLLEIEVGLCAYR